MSIGWGQAAQGISELGAAWLGYDAQRKTNNTNIKLGREQMAFQEEMSSSAYQRGVQDMKKAGLNPMLAYSQGGASTPMGSMPQVKNPVEAAGNTGQAAASIITALQGIQQSQAQTEQLEAGTKKIESETLNRDVATALQAQELTNKKWEREKLEEDVRNIHTKTRDLQREFAAREDSNYWAKIVKGDEAKANLYELAVPREKAEAAFYEGLGKMNPYLRMLIEILRGGSSARGLLGGR